MFSTLKKRIKNEKGLSLVELLAVIVILGIVAAIAIPAIGNIINSTRDKAQIADALTVISGAKLAHIENKCGVAGCVEKDLKDYVEGITLTDVSAVINKDNLWEVNFPFDFKSNQFEGKTPKTEDDLKKLLDPDAPAADPAG